MPSSGGREVQGMRVPTRSSRARGRWALRMTLALAVAVFGSLIATVSSNATPGSLHVLITGNCFDEAVTPLATALAAQPGVADVTTFDTSTGTPSAATLAAQDLVVSLGDDCTPYADQATWGNELADYIDGGGVVLQAAYDNWDAAPAGDANPTGRFASGGYAPLDLGPNDNSATTLGEVEQPSNPIVQGLGTFATGDNTTTPLAAGATLLAKWADGRNAIAIKGRVVATSASADDSSASIAILARNVGNYMGRHLVTVTKSGSGTGTVTSSPSGISCGATCATRVAFGNSLTLTATAGPNSRFAGWQGACSGTGPCVATDNGADVAVTAVFVAQHTLTVATAGSGSGSVASSPAGISCGATCSHVYDSGTTVSLTASSAAGSKFAGWSGGGCSGTGACAVAMSADQSVTARFTANPPNTKILKAMISSKKRKATFKFKAIGKGTGFQCALLRKPAHSAKFKACHSPKTYKKLKPGKYTFEVRAVGPGGVDRTPAKKAFKLKR